MEFICNLDKDLGTKIQNKGAQESSLEGSITAPSHNGVLTTTKYSNITTCSREADMTHRREVWGESGIQNDMGSAKGHLERGSRMADQALCVLQTSLNLLKWYDHV